MIVYVRYEQRSTDMGADSIDREMIELAENHRQSLGEEFFSYRDEIEANLLRSRWPEIPKARGPESTPERVKLADAILSELRVLLCTDEERYADVRKQGGAWSKTAITAVAGYITASLGVSAGLATGGVVFISLVILRVGVGAFCRVATPRAPNQPG